MRSSEVKEAAPKYNHRTYTIDEYLTIERSSVERRCELHNGSMVKLPDVTLDHVKIVRNLLVEVNRYLYNKDCEVLANELKTLSCSTNSVLYPDLIITCGELMVYDNEEDILLNPSVIIEVFTPATEDADRGNKYYYYRQIESVQEYILIDASSHYVFTSVKQQNGQWLSAETNDPSATLTIKTINFTLPLSEIYRRVSF